MTQASYIPLMSAWPSRLILADDVNQNINAVNQWFHRDSLPACHWDTLIQAARKRKISGVTLEALSRIAKEKASA